MLNYSKPLSKVSFWFVIVGALVLGGYGLTGYDVIEYLLAGDLLIVADILYILMGVAAIHQLVLYFSSNKK